MSEIISRLPPNRADRMHLMAAGQTEALYASLSAPDAASFVHPTLLEGSTHQHPETSPTRPIDEITGLPLCFVPNPNIPGIIGHNVLRRADWDHHFTRAETRNGANPVLDLPYARYGLMHLRLQWSTWEEHHETWNKYDMVGPMQPATPQQLAATICFGLSGYIPRRGIVLTKAGPQYCSLSDEQRKTSSITGQVMPQDTNYPIAYLRWFVAQQATDHIRDTEIEEFLGTGDERRRVYLAYALAAKLVERAVEPFDDTYVRLFRGNELRALYVRRGVYVPPSRNPRDLLQTTILAKVGIRRMMQDLALTFQPAAGRGLAAA